MVTTEDINSLYIELDDLIAFVSCWHCGDVITKDRLDRIMESLNAMRVASHGILSEIDSVP
jgi:hypothetical protein